MKNLIIIAIALVTLNATAQERQKEGHKQDMKERMEMREQMTPEEIAQLQTKKLTLELELTEKQQDDINKFLVAEATQRKAKMEEFKAKREKADGERLSKDDRLKMANERLDHQIEQKKKMKAILDAEQYEKFEKMQDKRRAMRSKYSNMRKHNK